MKRSTSILLYVLLPLFWALVLKHLSLPRWFGFARDLPPGVQVALDNISGTLPFELTPQ